MTLPKAWPNGAPVSTDTGQEFVQQLSIMGRPADVSCKVEQEIETSLEQLKALAASA